MDQSRAALGAFVKQLASRSVLTDIEENALMELGGQVTTVASHTDMVRQGQEVTHACLVVDGLVGRFGQNCDGGRQIIGLYIPGDVSDLHSVVSPNAGWGLASLAQTTALRIPHVAIRRAAAKHPGIAEAFWRHCAADGSILADSVINVGRRKALARVAHLLCELAVRYEKAGCGTRTSFLLPLTQSDLSDAIGLTPVHTNRIIRELRVRSIVDLRGGIVTVHSWDQLVDTGEFDATYLLLDGPALRITQAPSGSASSASRRT